MKKIFVILALIAFSGAFSQEMRINNNQLRIVSNNANLPNAGGAFYPWFTLSDTLTQASTWSGIVLTGKAGEALAIGDVCYLKSDRQWWLADADSAATMPGVAISTGTISAGSSGTLLLMGRIRYDSWSLTVGGIVYPSTTKRTLTQTAPSGTGDQVQAIGIATTVHELLFTPYPILVEK
jgi:hypothetical protein